MAVKKDVVAPKAEVKVEAPKAEVKAAAPKAEVKAEAPKAEVKAEAPKAEKKAAAPKAEKKAAAPKAEKKAAAPKAEKKVAAKKADVKAAITVQFGGKEYSQADLVKIAQDVWAYDLGKKADDFKSVELYVKPEESKVYYVINGEVSGDFNV